MILNILWNTPYKGDVYENIYELNTNKKDEVLIFCDNRIADMLCKEKHYPIITELSFRCRKHFSCFCHTNIFCYVIKY